MKLKCIGGICNGRIWDVENYYYENDIVKVAGIVEFKIADFEKELEAFRKNQTPESFKNPYHLYKITVIHFSNNVNIKFLIPHNWTCEQAMLYILT